MSLDHSIGPFENEASLLILAQFAHERASFRDARMKSSVEPLIQFFSPSISQQLS